MRVIVWILIGLIVWGAFLEWWEKSPRAHGKRLSGAQGKMKRTYRLVLPRGARHMLLVDSKGKVLLEHHDYKTRADIEAGLIDFERSKLVDVLYARWREIVAA